MNKEQQELLDEVYNKWIKYSWNSRIYPSQNDKDIFIDRIKTKPDFSIKLGLKIEKRELSLEERTAIFHNGEYSKHDNLIKFKDIGELNKAVPTKLITITYNDKTIESYE